MSETINTWEDLQVARVAAEPAIEAMYERLRRETPTHISRAFHDRRVAISNDVSRYRALKSSVSGRENSANLKTVFDIFKELRSNVARWESLGTPAIVSEIAPPPPPPPPPAKPLMELVADALDAIRARGTWITLQENGKFVFTNPGGVVLTAEERSLLAARHAVAEVLRKLPPTVVVL